MNELPVGQQKFINLAHHLSPAYVRVGGTSADCLTFVQDQVGLQNIIFFISNTFVTQTYLPFLLISKL